MNGEEERAENVTCGNLICDWDLLEARRGRDGENWRRGLEAAVAISERKENFETGERIREILYKIVGYLCPLEMFTNFQMYNVARLI